MSGPDQELLLEFPCAGETLVGILHGAEAARGEAVIVVVGGPQTRVGSHRQFVLLARRLAQQGIACLRFDYRGMGDAPGAPRDFEACAEDIRAAVDALRKACPQAKRITLWGLCDGATAALFQAAEDARIDGLILLNPWVRTEALASDALVRHYYVRRLLEPSFWRKLLSGGMNPVARLREFAGHLHQARAHAPSQDQTDTAWRDAARGLPERFAAALAAFRKPLLLILSGNDLTAQEFLAAEQHCPALAEQTTRTDVSRQTVVGANHTFSSARWRREVEDLCLAWLDDPLRHGQG